MIYLIADYPTLHFVCIHIYKNIFSNKYDKNQNCALEISK